MINSTLPSVCPFLIDTFISCRFNGTDVVRLKAERFANKGILLDRMIVTIIIVQGMCVCRSNVMMAAKEREMRLFSALLKRFRVYRHVANADQDDFFPRDVLRFLHLVGLLRTEERCREQK